MPGRDTARGLFARAVALPILLVVLAVGTFAVLRRVSYLAAYRHDIDRVGIAIAIAIGVLLVQRVLDAIIARASRGVVRPQGGPGGRVLPLARRALSIAIWAIGILAILDQLGIAISPLLAGLGISGIAVALALQPLLTNLFAASYILSDSSINVGDHIQLQGGPSGRVEGIGWRATRMRDGDGSLVIVPNATLASATVTNYGVSGTTVARVMVALPRSADLEAVERVATEGLRALIADDEHAMPDRDPVVRLQGFTDDDKVRCLLAVHARSQADVAPLTHAIVQRVAGRLGVSIGQAQADS